MKKSILSLAVAGATLASASVMFSANSAQAFNVTYNWSFDHSPSTPSFARGTFVADNVTGNLSSIAGTIGYKNVCSTCERPILGLAPGKNKIPLPPLGELSGINFYSTLSSIGIEEILKVEIFNGMNGDPLVDTLWLPPQQSLADIGISAVYLSTGRFTYSPVPEPLPILGSGIALGFGGFLKRKLGKSQKV